MTEYLVSLIAEHSQLDVIDSASSVKLATIGKVRPSTVLRTLRVICTAIRLLARRRCFVYLAPSQMGPALARDLLLWGLAVARADQVVLHIHGCGFHRLGTSGPWPRRTLVRMLGRRTRFILLGTRYRPKFISGIPKSAGISYLPNAITPDMERALTIPSGPREHGTLRLLYVGAVSRYKLFAGLNTIVGSAAIATTLDRLDVKLEVLIAGQYHGRFAAEELEYIRSRADKRIELNHLGGVYSAEAKGQLFASADCFLLPTTHPTEGFPVTLVEALCAGLPIIASDLGLCGDAVTNQNGWLVPPGNSEALEASILELLGRWRRSELAEQRAASRALFVKDFSHQTFKERVLELLAGSNPSGPRVSQECGHSLRNRD